ncbi:MAG: hypothetical protein H0T92_08550 [Pyrinomonadaceae bacterium]|nr:hypothetical protein [Pyrinomonadaceae bacterium]
MKRILFVLSLVVFVAGLSVLSLFLSSRGEGIQALVPSVQAGDGGSVAPRLEGTWRVTVTPRGAPPGTPSDFQSLITFTRGGALLESNTFLPPAAATTGHGTWHRTGYREFTYTFEKFLADNPTTPETPNDPGIFRVRETLHIERDSYTGSATAEICDAVGGGCVSIGCSTNVGTRMAAEAPVCPL